MIYMRSLSIGFFCIAALLSLFFETDQAKAKDPFLDVQIVTSPSGITAWLVEDHSLPIIAVEAAFLESGAAINPEDRQGITQLLSNTLDEGAGDLDSQQFQKKLTDHAISLYFHNSRDTFSLTLQTLSKHKDLAFDLLKKALHEPHFDGEAVERMRKSNISRIKSSLSDPDWIAARIRNDKFFSGHPYALNSGGTLSSLPAITPKDLKDFSKKILRRDALQISVTGDITKNELAGILDEVFAPLPTAQDIPSVADVTYHKAQAIYVYEKDVPQTFFEITFPAIERTDPDYYPLKVMNHIFGESGFGSRLMDNARDKNGLTYGIYSRIRHYLHANTVNITTSTKNDSAQQMLDIIREEIKRIKEEPVSQDELQRAKQYITGSLPLSLTSTDRISSILQRLQRRELPPNYLDHYAQKINAVTAEDIQRVAQKIFKNDHMHIVLVGKPNITENITAITEIPNVH